MTKEEIEALKTKGFYPTSLLLKLIAEYEQLQKENAELKSKIIERNEENAILNCSLQKIIENQSQMLKALKPYLAVDETDRKDGKGKEYRCYVKNGYRDNYFNISKEEYELFKGWLKND